MGMKVNLESTSGDGAVFVAAGENGDKSSLTVAIGKRSGRDYRERNLTGPDSDQPWPKYISQPNPNSAPKKQRKV